MPSGRPEWRSHPRALLRRRVRGRIQPARFGALHGAGPHRWPERSCGKNLKAKLQPEDSASTIVARAPRRPQEHQQLSAATPRPHDSRGSCHDGGHSKTRPRVKLEVLFHDDAYSPSDGTSPLLSVSNDGLRTRPILRPASSGGSSTSPSCSAEDPEELTCCTAVSSGSGSWSPSSRS